MTCVSRGFDCSWQRKPTILLFDLHGRQVEHAMQPVAAAGGWRADMRLSDCQQIAVIE